MTSRVNRDVNSGDERAEHMRRQLERRDSLKNRIAQWSSALEQKVGAERALFDATIAEFRLELDALDASLSTHDVLQVPAGDAPPLASPGYRNPAHALQRDRWAYQINRQVQGLLALVDDRRSTAAAWFPSRESAHLTAIHNLASYAGLPDEATVDGGSDDERALLMLCEGASPVDVAKALGSTVAALRKRFPTACRIHVALGKRVLEDNHDRAREADAFVEYVTGAPESSTRKHRTSTGKSRI